jgi:hypothetical protein
MMRFNLSISDPRMYDNQKELWGQIDLLKPIMLIILALRLPKLTYGEEWPRMTGSSTYAVCIPRSAGKLFIYLSYSCFIYIKDTKIYAPVRTSMKMVQNAA